jgi:hypothetical protein
MMNIGGTTIDINKQIGDIVQMNVRNLLCTFKPQIISRDEFHKKIQVARKKHCGKMRIFCMLVLLSTTKVQRLPNEQRKAKAAS